MYLNLSTKLKEKNLSPNISQSCFRIFNIGSGRQTSLMTYIKIIEKNLNIIAKKNIYLYKRVILKIHYQILHL